MATLLFLGPSNDGERDTYVVNEDIDTVVQSLTSDARFVRFTDPGDGEPVWFRADAIRYFYAN
ncbi:hypothetical protein DSM112329_03132 [Paraconexibacter sp. AEG42_29]|uniref:Uncharacterized protein n=1 Tax=Paraconexibacter sp. AEG42_29 TaxID=2997339 RepID=A0AAU7AX29_9ACTN